VTIEAAVIKRKARWAGEIGLFGVDQEADEEIKRLGEYMVWAEITVPRSLRQMRFLWALFQKLADGGLYEDKEEAKEDLLMRAKWKHKVVKGDQIVEEPRSIAGVRSDLLSRLINRIVFVVCADVLPHISEADLRQEIEEMLG
jgi:hypothetical protein